MKRKKFNKNDPASTTKKTKAEKKADRLARKSARRAKKTKQNMFGMSYFSEKV